jgi:hypothetical protein
MQNRMEENVILNAVLKKKNSLGLFYKRIVTLTDEPRLFYMKTSKEKSSVPKQISLHADYTKLERLDSTKFKLCDSSRGKKYYFVFRCFSAQECEQWVMKLSIELDKLKGFSPGKRLDLYKQGSHSQINLPSLALKKM